MSTFTVHVPPGIADDARRAERTIFVREGFDWPAFFLGPLSLLFRGMWRASLAWAVVGTALFGLSVGFGLTALPCLTLYLILAGLTGLEAGELRRRALGRAGFISVALLTGVTRDTVERMFFGAAVGRPLFMPTLAARSGRTAGAHDVIGLFPQPLDRGTGYRT